MASQTVTMHLSTSTVLAVAVTAATTVSAQVTGALGNAPVTTGNSADILYEASFSSSNVEMGYLNFTGTSDGVGVLVHVCFKGINASQPGPYPYHIHGQYTSHSDDPFAEMQMQMHIRTCKRMNEHFVVGPNGNCSATGAHLDPFLRNDTVKCDAGAPETCQVGDLSGKHGDIPAGVYDYCTSYVDKYLSLVPGNVAFIGNSRSVVIHNINLTRIGCGNIVQGTVKGNGMPTPSNTTYPPTPPGGNGGNNVTTIPTPAPPIATGGATSLRASMALGVILAVGSLVL
ncbi:Cell surface Cu-only superoxide dismutase [Drechslerella dactyloides]|uniref:Cell surface Cu-only superoxide dismutase n=1 Tax=Drechslerella dactyloides TaxID=74499 RepID=A0AAD6IRU0_DREDA|nr:Cell surface Cu-only superoxide dismutase [Drechslerella dactyloides]